MTTKTFTTNIILNRRVRGAGHGYVNEPVKCRVDVAIDLDKLFAELGERALGNKSKRSVEMGGIIIAEVRTEG